MYTSNSGTKSQLLAVRHVFAQVFITLELSATVIKQKEKKKKLIPARSVRISFDYTYEVFRESIINIVKFSTNKIL